MSLTLNELIRKLKAKEFKKITIAAGAGISVAAGLSDYRSKDTGLYDQLKKFNLSNPEQVYDINVFRKNPSLYYSVSKEFGTHNLDLQPTFAHQFIYHLDRNDQLLNCFTQNIDGLELVAGVRESKVIQVHGHRRTASCIDCKKTYCVKTFYQNVDKSEIMKCTDCNGLIKPDVVFFGQSLPQLYFEKLPEISLSDLVIIMGTSLQVQPFSNMIYRINENVPIVLINKETNLRRLDPINNKLLIKGDVQDIISSIMKQL
ncbi:unnamed protein product (macronuclear) [Paramecium tetraurelia]|uniref:Deacetylase sirtuin-type domain-containing protein n=1 Tax=Paramecium tetraurelia TaxID=5888 RepID=A0C2R2_PARTE|nr:uncharacterized protein GSPATT00034557001 [Paramecium tetraurelia]CAK65079.1 unnamed protein product [Paramecium tetraurelia]|eukprot:XP_001432476.1 hypothetical protein (macronuclear) [Paramecium tetraurelia strain d4-2]